MNSPVLDNARMRHEQNPETFERSITPPVIGSFAKVCQMNLSRPERFWVQITAIEDKTIFGRVANNLLYSELQPGQLIDFHIDCVFAQLPADTPIAPDENNNVRGVHDTCNGAPR